MHEAADTRVYTQLARFVSLTERQAKHAASTSIAHAAPTRQLVDFFEMQALAFVTAAVAIVGSVVMPVILAPLSVPLPQHFCSSLVWRPCATCGYRSSLLLAFTRGKSSAMYFAPHFQTIGGRLIQLTDL